MAGKGTIRRSQLITTYGVGSMVACEAESFMVAGLDRWGAAGPNLFEPRLERRLGVPGFVLPPARGKGHDIPVVRFPVWCFCPTCLRLDRHGFFAGFDANKCNRCNARLVPSRFVICCDRGHIDDFPYSEWVHNGPRPGEGHNLQIRTAGTSASLRDIIITCDCGASRSMEGAFGKNALRGVLFGCSGRRPWLSDREQCPSFPRTLQRGASNVWWPIVHSSLSIPPWSEGAFRLLNRYWLALKYIPLESLEPTIRGMGIARGTPYTVEALVLAVRQRRENEEGGGSNLKSIKEEEYEALVIGQEEVSADQEFVCVPSPERGPLTSAWFDQVMLVKRLREVRALQSFTRLMPWTPGDPDSRRAPLFGSNPGWLPAIEVSGEGVFLRLSEGRLRDWETRESVRARAAVLLNNYLSRMLAYGVPAQRIITARFILIHSLAHVLISQWALECGYPAASLRERLYVSESMAGLMLYTATSDSAGSLGGVIAQADDRVLENSLREAIARAAWCSADPLCIETAAAGVDALNLAACHACALLPEVSCEEMNLFLDRGLLVGLPESPEVGFFREMLES